MSWCEVEGRRTSSKPTGGKGVYVSSNPHLRKAQQAAQYSTSALGRAQAECFAPVPDGLGAVSDLADAEIAYAGSGALHASAVAKGLAESLELLDSDAGVRSHLRDASRQVLRRSPASGPIRRILQERGRVRFDLDKAQRLDRTVRFHERVRPLTLSRHVVADDSQFQLTLVQV